MKITDHSAKFAVERKPRIDSLVAFEVESFSRFGVSFRKMITNLAARRLSP